MSISIFVGLSPSDKQSRSRSKDSCQKSKGPLLLGLFSALCLTLFVSKTAMASAGCVPWISSPATGGPVDFGPNLSIPPDLPVGSVIKTITVTANSTTGSCQLISYYPTINTTVQIGSRSGLGNIGARDPSWPTCPTNIAGLGLRVHWIGGTISVNQDGSSIPGSQYWPFQQDLCWFGGTNHYSISGRVLIVSINNPVLEFSLVKTAQQVGEGRLDLSSKPFTLNMNFLSIDPQYSGPMPLLQMSFGPPTQVAARKPNCRLSNNQVTQVAMPAIDAPSLNAGTKDAQTPFSLTFDCDANAQLALQFDGNQAAPGILALNTVSGAASGFGIAMTRDDTSANVNLGELMNFPARMSSGSWTVPFKARYKKISGQAVKGGLVNSSATFTMTFP